ncbi:unnamed protein product, partial [Brassica oleracea]
PAISLGSIDKTSSSPFHRPHSVSQTHIEIKTLLDYRAENINKRKVFFPKLQIFGCRRLLKLLPSLINLDLRYFSEPISVFFL